MQLYCYFFHTLNVPSDHFYNYESFYINKVAILPTIQARLQ